MKTTTKKISQLLLSGGALVCLSLAVGFSFGNPISANAEEAETYYCPGASIRLRNDDKNGIRFPMYMANEQYNTLTSSENVTIGTLIIPTKLLGGGYA